jgi:hypothetical protein
LRNSLHAKDNIAIAFQLPRGMRTQDCQSFAGYDSFAFLGPTAMG